MTEDEQKLLSTFEARLRHLLFLHDELKRENLKLNQSLEEERRKTGQVLADYKTLEAGYTNLKMAAAMGRAGTDIKETKLRLSKLVREVDKCITLLNEQQ